MGGNEKNKLRGSIQKVYVVYLIYTLYTSKSKQKVPSELRYLVYLDHYRSLDTSKSKQVTTGLLRSYLDL